jgi:hypothetical protein
MVHDEFPEAVLKPPPSLAHGPPGPPAPGHAATVCPCAPLYRHVALLVPAQQCWPTHMAWPAGRLFPPGAARLLCHAASQRCSGDPLRQQNLPGGRGAHNFKRDTTVARADPSRNQHMPHAVLVRASQMATDYGRPWPGQRWASSDARRSAPASRDGSCMMYHVRRTTQRGVDARGGPQWDMAPLWL